MGLMPRMHSPAAVWKTAKSPAAMLRMALREFLDSVYNVTLQKIFP